MQRLPITLPVRTWAALDAALSFFRETPAAFTKHNKFVRPCKELHGRLHRLGVRHHYVNLGTSSEVRPLLRLHVSGLVDSHRAIPLPLAVNVARELAKACTHVIDTQLANQQGLLLDHEAEEVQAARAFLTALRRIEAPIALPNGRGLGTLRWNDRAATYEFDTRCAFRLQTAFLQQGASLN